MIVTLSFDSFYNCAESAQTLFTGLQNSSLEGKSRITRSGVSTASLVRRDRTPPILYYTSPEIDYRPYITPDQSVARTNQNDTIFGFLEGSRKGVLRERNSRRSFTKNYHIMMTIILWTLTIMWRPIGPIWPLHIRRGRFREWAAWRRWIGKRSTRTVNKTNLDKVSNQLFVFVNFACHHRLLLRQCWRGTTDLHVIPSPPPSCGPFGLA